MDINILLAVMGLILVTGLTVVLIIGKTKEEERFDKLAGMAADLASSNFKARREIAKMLEEEARLNDCLSLAHETINVLADELDEKEKDLMETAIALEFAETTIHMLDEILGV